MTNWLKKVLSGTIMLKLVTHGPTPPVTGKDDFVEVMLLNQAEPS